MAAALFLLGTWLLRSFWLPWLVDDPGLILKKRFSSGGAWLDRHKNPLRLYADDNGDFFCYSPLASHSQNIFNALLTAEDRGFFQHPGFDAVAIGRALWQNLTNMKVVSGASTISQQLIRILKPRPRNVSSKIVELFEALRLEDSYSKKEILEFYVNQVPMFGNIRGFYLASLLLFRKTPDLLSLAESATLAALVQSPGRLSPFNVNGNKRLRKRRDWIIREMLALGYCRVEQAREAISTNIPEYRSQLPFKAPHFCDLLTLSRGQPKGNQITTISQPLQDLLQDSLKAHLPRLARYGARQACGMIVDARKMEILAMAGSVEYGPVAAGFNNGCIARRSGGSILKPFLYALALEQGFYPSFVIADTMQPFKTPQGEYLPYNADRRDYGPVTIRNALGNSLNVSAVKMLNMVGIKDFFHLLVELELLDSFGGAADFFGLGLAIGNPEIRMLDLVRAYGILVNQGRLKTLSFLVDDKTVDRQLIRPGSAYLIFDILSDPAARLLTFGTPSFFKFSSRWALKTGTSTNYRDSWLVACNRNYIVALWVGNFDGSPTRSLSGASACGPVIKNIISALEASGNLEPIPVPAEISKVAVCSISGQKPGPFCRLTGFDLVDGDADSLPDCQFHRSELMGHELPADYARWIQTRARMNDADPFQLLGSLRSADAWRIFGLQPDPKPVAPASGPIILKAEPANGSWNNIKIVAPHDGDRFILAATDNFLHLRAIPEQPVEEIIWLINGSEFIRTPPPYEAYWPMREGRIRVTALTSGEAAAEVEILIER